MSFFKKTVIGLLAACMLLGCVACSGTDGQTDTEPDAVTGESETDPVRVDKVDVKLGGEYANIVYAVDADAELKAATKSFAVSYAKIVGADEVTPEKSGTYKADKAEILVGKVRYPECDEIYETLKYSEVKVCVVGNKLVIAGYDSATMIEALEELLVKLGEKADANGNISLGGDFSIEKTFAAPLSAVPVLQGIKPVFVDTGDDCYMVKFGTVQRDTFTAYCENMVNNGLKLYAEKTIDGNVYKTFTNDKYVVTTIYTKYNGMGKVLAEPISETALPTRAEDNVYTPVAGCETTITQVGLLNDNLGRTYNGMCYVIRLADGSFIIVDGGFGLEGYDDRIYNILKKQAPDPDNIVIAAWMITHAHDDHTDVFEDFFKAYADKVTIEKFICNIPSADQLVDNWANEKDGNIAYSAKVRELLNSYFTDVPVIKAHPGQEFYIRNAKINILFTVDVYDKKLDDFNNTSVVFKLEAEGKSMLFLGDYDDKGVTIPSLYKEGTLKSDIMQMAHHGLPENSSNAMASTIQPTYVFWPAGAQIVKGDVDLFAVQQNQWVLTNCKDNIYLAEDNVYVLTMKDCTVVKYETVAAYLAS